MNKIKTTTISTSEQTYESKNFIVDIERRDNKLEMISFKKLNRFGYADIGNYMFIHNTKELKDFIFFMEEILPVLKEL